MNDHVSMEEFGPVSVDYYHGRKVEEIIEGDGGQGDPVWSIRFEGDGLLHNFDPTYPAPPPDIVGLALTLTVLGAKKTGGEGTVLYFGDALSPRKMQMNISPLQYAIQDMTYTQGRIVFAQRSEFNMPGNIPGHPDARIAEGLDEDADDDAT